MTTSLSPTARQRIWRAQGRRCPWCAKPITPGEFAFATTDHVRPIAHKGSGLQSNLAIMHQACNSEKGSWCPGCEMCAGFTSHLLQMIQVGWLNAHAEGGYDIYIPDGGWREIARASGWVLVKSS